GGRRSRGRGLAPCKPPSGGLQLQAAGASVGSATDRSFYPGLALSPRWQASLWSVRIGADWPLEKETAMRNKALVASGRVIVGGVVLRGPGARTRAGPAAKQEKEAKSASLPIGQVVLYSSGVGYFQREGSVEGDSRVDLSFPVSDINDLIKSMVLRDLDGGHISAVSYDSNAPIERTLKSFAVNLTGNPSLAD